jgi:para-nitrobenzyl esterase
MVAHGGLLPALLLLLALHRLTAQRIANTTSGKVEGKVYQGCDVWRGIPFAEPPLGHGRWQSPKPKKQWEGVRPAKTPQQQCPQLDLLKGIYLGNEDCLYLSVYAPPSCSAEAPLGINPIVTLEKQVLNMIGKLV